MSAKFDIILRGPQGSGKSKFLHKYLIPALRAAGLGAEVFEEGVIGRPGMTLTGKPFVNVFEEISQ